MDRFEDLRTFVALAQAGGFKAAGARLGIATSAVSRRLRDLEARLQVRLVQRTSRHVALTDAGRLYHRQAVDVLGALEAMDDAVRGHGRTLGGRLRITAPVTFTARWLAPAMAAFQDRHPDIALELETSDRFADIVQEGFDLAIRIGSLPDSSLIARRIVSIHHVVCASPGYLAAQGRPGAPADLVRHRGVTYGYRDEDAYWTFADGVVAKPRTTLRVNNGDVLREIAIAGGGLIYVPTFAVADAIEAGQLDVVLAGWARPPIAMHAVFPDTRHMPARARAFVDFIVSQFGDPPPWDRQIARAGGRAPDA